MRVFLGSLLLVSHCFGQAIGTWRMNAARSSFSDGAQPKSLIVRIEPRRTGEVFTLDTFQADGRTMSSSTILYLDGSARDLYDFECSGTQSSRLVDSQTVEILRTCGSGQWARWVRRISANTEELVLEITEQRQDGRRIQRHLVLEKEKGRT